MKYFAPKVVVTLSLLIISMMAHAAKDQDNLITTAVNAFMEKHHIPGVAVEVYRGGEPSSYYFGYANREKKIPVSAHTIFEVGSIAKLMTSLLLAQEVDFAKVQLDTPLKQVLPELPLSMDHITLGMLATHTSGFPIDVPKSITNRAELDKYLNEKGTALNTNKQWQYSNFGVGMLSLALENQTQKDFNQLYRNHILNPLGMHDVPLRLSNRLKAQFAQGYDKNNRPAKATEAGLFQAANVKLSPADMQRFLGASIGLPNTPTRILYPMRMTQSVYVKLPSWAQGLGWQIHPLTKHDKVLTDKNFNILAPQKVAEIETRPYFDGNALIDKTGATQGFRAYIAVLPNKQSGIVILTNKYVGNQDIVNLGRDILFQLAKKQDVKV
ncbi:MAG: serine hydrolase [Gammaproteobacteria bacterium]|nr:serine hydrolase [Gammaproteobacteria bacterium]